MLIISADVQVEDSAVIECVAGKQSTRKASRTLAVCGECLTLRLRSHRNEYESRFPFTGCLSLVQASPARVERSRSLVQAHNSTRDC